MLTKKVDIVIVGGGIVGLTAALLFAKYTPLSIALVDAQAKPDLFAIDSPFHHRVSAITLASMRLFSALGLKAELLALRANPIAGMQVGEGSGEGSIEFNAKQLGQSQLGFIIENNAIIAALIAACQHYPQLELTFKSAVKDFAIQDQAVFITTDTDVCYQAKLAIAADGANSELRKAASIAVKQKPYAQMAIVATVKTEKPHANVARQLFLNTGPLAFLPLRETHTSSIVWSLVADEAEAMLALDDAAFCQALTIAFKEQLGLVIECSKRYAFPLQTLQAENYYAERLALIGDAAHVVHPLAGQGVNIGLTDAASLLDVIKEAILQKRDFAHPQVLRRYNRWRKADNLPLLMMIDQLNQLFLSEQPWLKTMRTFGLNATNQFLPLKRFLTEYAVGQRGDLPSMMS